MRLTVDVNYCDAFEETKHPRGQPENAGEFAKKGQAAARKPSAVKQVASKPAVSKPATVSTPLAAKPAAAKPPPAAAAQADNPFAKGSPTPSPEALTKHYILGEAAQKGFQEGWKGTSFFKNPYDPINDYSESKAWYNYYEMGQATRKLERVPEEFKQFRGEPDDLPPLIAQAPGAAAALDSTRLLAAAKIPYMNVNQLRDQIYGVHGRDEYRAAFDPAAQQALLEYSSPMYGQLGTALWNGSWERKPKTRQRVAELDRAIAAAPPLLVDVTAYRGTALPDDQIADLIKRLNDKQPATLTNPAYTSSTKTRSTAKLYADSAASKIKKLHGTSNRVVIRMLLPKGTKAVNMADMSALAYSDEMELLLGRNQQLKVLGVRKVRKGSYYIDATV